MIEMEIMCTYYTMSAVLGNGLKLPTDHCLVPIPDIYTNSCDGYPAGLQTDTRMGSAAVDSPDEI